jgi:hypothetical protein
MCWEARKSLKRKFYYLKVRGRARPLRLLPLCYSEKASKSGHL